ncbi:hypothetical protein MRB53_017049 [Persea americana]|uniref:Uncharacterized protein n=1 Tax=Persea americana TaxID=3435 RepID=A0ACC2M3Z4_PERAE|nr:hypothetical protein MRB53_017049 [Persea americana]
MARGRAAARERAAGRDRERERSQQERGQQVEIERERDRSKREGSTDEHTISVSLIKSLQRSKQQIGFFHAGDELHLRFKIGWNGGRRWFF